MRETGTKVLPTGFAGLFSPPALAYDGKIVALGWFGERCTEAVLLSTNTVCSGEEVVVEFYMNERFSVWNWLEILYPFEYGDGPSGLFNYTDEYLSKITDQEFSDYEYTWETIGQIVDTEQGKYAMYRFNFHENAVGTGSFIISLNFNSQWDMIGWDQLDILSSSDSRCIEKRNQNPSMESECIANEGIWDDTTGCTCPEGFFGPVCEHGCSQFSIVEGFGGEFSSSRKGVVDLEYLNYVDCWYLLYPTKDEQAGIESITLSFDQFLMESGNDMVEVWSVSHHQY